VPIPTVWCEPEPVEVPSELVDLCGSRLAAELVFRRGYRTRDLALPFLDPWLHGPTDPAELPGVDRAVERLKRAVERREQLLVWGDFDVDGQSATAVLVLALRRLGLSPHWHVPRRATDSHGLNASTREHAERVGATVVVTCDCGIGDGEHMEALAAGGVDVIVTDHHAMPAHMGDRPHPAHALVWPGFLSDDHPAHPLSGVGVAYFLAAALLRAFGESADDLLDLVALGTIADVAPLTGDNRRLVQRGLPALNAGKRPGIRTLLTLANRLNAAPMDAGVAGWIIAPPLNAFGRLGKADPAVELLMAEDDATIAPIAADAYHLNQQRQGHCEQIVATASDLVESALVGRPAPSLCLASEAAIVAADPAWHLGVIGLAAGRLAQIYLRPVALATRDGVGIARVSVRSAPWCDLNPVIHALVRDESLGFRGGSHPAAAGGELPWDQLQRFAEGFDRAAAGQRLPGPLARKLSIDAELRLSDATLDSCRALARLAPFGNGNPPPLLLVRGVRVAEPPRQMGYSQRHLRLSLSDGDGRRGTAVWWDGATRSLPAGRVDLCLSLEENEFDGRVEPRLVVQAVRPSVHASSRSPLPLGEGQG
jgi:single-stranded-DNA-specific exonuclease